MHAAAAGAQAYHMIWPKVRGTVDEYYQVQKFKKNRYASAPHASSM